MTIRQSSQLIYQILERSEHAENRVSLRYHSHIDSINREMEDLREEEKGMEEELASHQLKF